MTGVQSRSLKTIADLREAAEQGLTRKAAGDRFGISKRKLGYFKTPILAHAAVLRSISQAMS